MERLETGDCGAIYAELLAEYESLYARLPEVSELCVRYVDRENDKLYGLHEMERKWVYRFLDEELGGAAELYEKLWF